MKRPWLQYRLWHMFLATTLVAISLKAYDVWNHRLVRIVERFNASMEDGDYSQAAQLAEVANVRYSESHADIVDMLRWKSTFALFHTQDVTTNRNSVYSAGFVCWLSEPIPNPDEWEAMQEAFRKAPTNSHRTNDDQ
jgi:hypothetical protein